MPIVEENDSVYVSYTMPKWIKEIITDEFLKEFRNQLFRIHEYYSLDVFADEGVPMNTSTSGWFAAFGKACLLTGSEQLLDYWYTLPWYDADIFDGELSEMLIEKGFILGDLSSIIEEKLGIKENDIKVCDDCGKLYTKDMVVEISEIDNNGMVNICRCLYCQDVKETKDGNGKATDYYRRILSELDDYKNSRVKEKVDV